MPKIKTHKATAKRIKTTSNNKLIRGRAFGNHMLSKKGKGRKRTIKTTAEVTGKMAKNIRKSLGI